MYASQRTPGMAKTVSVVREKTKKPMPVSSASAMVPGSLPGTAGPKGLDANRDAWANALQTMGGVYTPDPITAAAKVAGMGLAGYGQTKATREKEAGTTAYRQKLADALSGTADNSTLMGLAADPYADDNSQRMIWEMWGRNNPTQDQLLDRRKAELEIDKLENPGPPDPNIVTLEAGKNRKLQFDLSIPEHRERYNQMIEELQQGGMVMDGPSQDIDNPMSITDNVASDKDIQTYAVAAPILRSMYGSLSDPSSISDLDFVSGVAKILDPNSVVREAEGKMVIESQSLPSQLLGTLNKLARGESALDPQTRVAMFKLAQRRADEARSAAEARHGFYRQMAEKNQYDPNTYVPPMPELPRGRIGEAMDRPQMPAGRPSGGAGPALPGGAATPVPGPAPARPAPSQPPPAVQQLPPGLWEQIQQDLGGDPGKIEAMIPLLSDPDAMADLRRQYPEFFTGPRRGFGGGGGGGGGW